MKRLTRTIVCIALVASGAATRCTSPTGPGGDEPPAFSEASISVDKNKKMTELTADERASVCAEFSRALTADFGSKAVGCKLRALFAEGQSSCQTGYEQCVNDSKPFGTINACTAAMQGMWYVCRATVGQYQACFNDRNRQLFDFLVSNPACTVPAGRQEEPPSCQAAPCDYDWISD
jgi:hypothetical protein